ncbi:hypothetical protein [Streptomyces sp. NPDC058268]|uniref:hypothetical protein n=1 Tax=Streptomyces sp. NPDC058268 TaxID=3346413 RepID=UPI0036EAE353
MTKSGSDHLKRQAREIARGSGRRYPDVLRQLRREPRPAPRRPPSKELVLLCSGLAHPLDPGRCARPAGHQQLDGTWSWCSSDPHLPAHIWQGHHQARDEAARAKNEAWLATLTPAERAAYEAEMEDAHWAAMADEAREPYDPYEDKYRFADDEPEDTEGNPGRFDDYADEYDDDEDYR